MGNLAIKLGLNALAIWVAAYFVTGMELNTNSILGVIMVAVVFGVVNAIIKPIVTILALPGILLTLGLLTFVINGLLLWLTAAMTTALDIQGFWPAVFGSIVISIVSFLLSAFMPSDD